MDILTISKYKLELSFIKAPKEPVISTRGALHYIPHKLTLNLRIYGKTGWYPHGLCRLYFYAPYYLLLGFGKKSKKFPLSFSVSKYGVYKGMLKIHVTSEKLYNWLSTYN